VHLARTVTRRRRAALPGQHALVKLGHALGQVAAAWGWISTLLLKLVVKQVVG
jgi:hypothetical protein